MRPRRRRDTAPGQARQREADRVGGRDRVDEHGRVPVRQPGYAATAAPTSVSGRPSPRPAPPVRPRRRAASPGRAGRPPAGVGTGYRNAGPVCRQAVDHLADWAPPRRVDDRHRLPPGRPVPEGMRDLGPARLGLPRPGSLAVRGPDGSPRALRRWRCQAAAAATTWPPWPATHVRPPRRGRTPATHRAGPRCRSRGASPAPDPEPRDRCVVEAVEITVGPAVHETARAAPGQRLHDHRSVVRQPPSNSGPVAWNRSSASSYTPMCCHHVPTPPITWT